ncbi:M6 family metalloprotease domain-containing protein, partial [bacterium]|nr:M6 family metalloprotease domain-containing protein [bacterium]
MESAVRKHTGAGLSHVCALLILASVVLPMRASAVGAFGQDFTARQPDGKEFPVRVWGDEYFRVAETLDGYTVTYEPQTPWITYATLSADGTELVSTGVRVVPAQAGNMQVQSTLPNLEKHVRITPESRAEKVANSRRTLMSPTREPGAIAPLAAGDWEPSLQGTVKGVCILIDFSDDPATVNRSAIDDMCNEQGYSGYGNNGSVHDYFYDVSEGVLTYTNHVTSYYRAQNPRTYYDNPSDVFGMGAQVLILEALDWLDSSGFDFSQYDTNGDGYIDALNLFYAGEAPPIWATGLWPHSGGLAYQVDGVETYRYQITNIGSALTIGTFCHENGHMLGGWPDFYDYEYDSIGIGFFCLMSAGNYGDDGRNPVEPNAFLKLISGWATLTVLTQPAQSLPAQAGINQIYKINNAQLATEYFLVENRQQSARDAAVPDAGLAIWHVDENGDRDSQQMTPDAHYVVSLEQADGRFDMEHNENYGDNTDLFRAPQYLAFNDTTLPDAHWWSGQASGISISEISFPRDTITFNFGGGG